MAIRAGSQDEQCTVTCKGFHHWAATASTPAGLSIKAHTCEPGITDVLPAVLDPLGGGPRVISCAASGWSYSSAISLGVLPSCAQAVCEQQPQKAEQQQQQRRKRCE